MTDPGGSDPGQLDPVEHAAATPDLVQPYADLGLADDEYARIRDLLGRRPTGCELAMYSVMWSEHCSYKSSKVHLREFADKAPRSDALLVGMGENAGVVDIGQGWAVTFKIESHNHPSFVEPYQGAATGVGGIVRDILSMGARPVAVLDPLRFGPLDAPDTGRVLPGVVAGIGGYGNCLGLPTIGGEVVFDPSYAGNPLVNALCVGVLRADAIKLAKGSGPGNRVVLYGAKTGRDGIGGVSVLASATFDSGGSAGDDSAAKKPSVQVGDPFTEKTLIECSLELFERDLVVGIQDLGGAGLSCATTELASAGTGGMRIELDRVHLREPSMAPHEVLTSESQERMCAIVAPGDVAEFLAICAKWDVPAVVIGEVTGVTPAEAARGGRLVISWHGQVVVDVPPRTVAHEGPVYQRPFARPTDQDALVADAPDAARLARPSTGAELRDTLLGLVGSANLCGKSWVTDQYDRYVQGNTVLAQPADAGMVRVDPASGLGVAVATDGNGRYTRLDPYAGAQLALAEAYRNVASTGARPLAVTNCLNFGSPEDPGVMWQFAEAVRGLADGCQALGVPVTGGNVSFYNQTGSVAILPTPIVGVLGVIDDVTRRTPAGFGGGGDVVLLLGTTADELGGSEWAHAIHDHLGGRPPVVDLAAERTLAELLIAGSRDAMLSAAHDLSDGGLAQALVESCLIGGIGARIVLPEELDPFVVLFAESAARAIVAVPRSAELRFTEMCLARRFPVARIGVVDGAAL
ncbi:MAG: phosphoribosylformylglycinamidine synthase subunit PurL, partial [Sporichthyaceae bacterium]|nr:phosphoribosylformylglycinamidine synthase subunit PurL [Sporichthyaceae bacterium]